MDETPGSVDIAAMFITLGERDGAPLTRMALQKLVSLSQSLYGYTRGRKLFNDNVLAFEYGPVTQEVRHAYKSSGGRAITTPVTELKRFSDDQIDALAEVYALFSSLDGPQLANETHDVGPWSRYYRKGEANIIPFDELAEAWPEYKLAAQTHAETFVDHTPGNYQMPESEVGKFDDLIEQSLKDRRAALSAR